MSFLPLLLALGATPATPRPPAVQAYLSARDAHVRAFEKSGMDTPTDAHQRALDDLEKRLRPIVGPVSVPALAGAGRINLESLIDAVGFGLLDGLRFERGHDTLVVTTRPLLDAWLSAAHRDPADLPALARCPRGVFFADADVVSFAEVPVRRPPALDLASAALVYAGQDFGPWPPQMLAVTATRGDRVYLAQLAPEPEPPQLAACEAAWTALEQQRGARFDRDEGFAAYRCCYGEAIRADAAFAGLTRRAQALVDDLAADAGARR